MTITIYHNPRCSKSRETLALAEAIASNQQRQLIVVEYLKQPLNADALRHLWQQTGELLDAFVRTSEEEFAANSLSLTDADKVFSAMAAAPKLMQRPVVVVDGRAVICRPPEKIHSLFAEAV